MAQMNSSEKLRREIFLVFCATVMICINLTFDGWPTGIQHFGKCMISQTCSHYNNGTWCTQGFMMAMKWSSGTLAFNNYKVTQIFVTYKLSWLSLLLWCWGENEEKIFLPDFCLHHRTRFSATIRMNITCS